MEDWQSRFIDEYNALKDKYTKLHRSINSVTSQTNKTY